MRMEWTPKLDAAALALIEDMPQATWDERAAVLSADAGAAITGDALSSRMRRLRNDPASQGLAEAVTVEPAPTGEYVGLTMAFLDLETTSLGAWTGELLISSLVDNFGEVHSASRFDFEQDSQIDDLELAIWTRDLWESFDVLVGWNIANFDLGFLNARLVYHGERPVARKLLIDPMFKARGGRYGARVGSSKLKNVALFFETPNQKPDVAPEVWRKANLGEVEALNELEDRCIADCQVLRDCFDRLKPFITTIHM